MVTILEFAVKLSPILSIKTRACVPLLCMENSPSDERLHSEKHVLKTLKKKKKILIVFNVEVK